MSLKASSVPATKKIKSEDDSKINGEAVTTTSIEALSVNTSYLPTNTFFNYHLRPKKGCDR